MDRNGDVLDSEMSGQFKLKLVGVVEGLWQNVMKGFFYLSKLTRVRSGME